MDTDFALRMLSREEYVKFNNATNDDQCMDVSASVRKAVTDTEANAIIAKISRCNNVTEFQQLDQKKKETYIKKIHKKGVSVRQLSRLTGISKGLIEKYLKV